MPQHPLATTQSQMQVPRGYRAAKWRDIPDEQWNDWRWQLSHRLNTFQDLADIINLTPDEAEGVRASGRFRLDITPYFASLIDPDDPTCPIRRQVVPTGQELVPFTSAMEDSLAEDLHSPVPGLVHRYPDRVLMLATTQCASYCRYCTRSRIVGDPHANFSPQEYAAQLDYLRRAAAGPAGGAAERGDRARDAPGRAGRSLPVWAAARTDSSRRNASTKRKPVSSCPTCPGWQPSRLSRRHAFTGYGLYTSTPRITACSRHGSLCGGARAARTPAGISNCRPAWTAGVKSTRHWGAAPGPSRPTLANRAVDL